MAISPGFSPGISTQPVNKGGTGATTASGARGNLGLAASTTDNAICRFDGTSGSTQNSGCTIDDTGNLSVSGTGTSTFAGDVQVAHATGNNAKVLAIKNTAPALNHIAQVVLAQGVGGGFGADDRTYQLVNNGVSSTSTEFLVQYWDGSSYSNRVKISPSGGVSILGTTTNDNAATGYVGEYVSSTVAIGSAVSLTNTTPANMTSISLTAGDWDVEVNANYNLSGASGVTLFSGVNTTSATFGDNSTYSLKHTPMTTVTAVDGLVSTIVRVSLSGSATVYAVVRADFSAGTVGAFGSMRARRVR